jgi:hypothetical protein
MLPSMAQIVRPLRSPPRQCAVLAAKDRVFIVRLSWVAGWFVDDRRGRRIIAVSGKGAGLHYAPQAHRRIIGLVNEPHARPCGRDFLRGGP